MNLDDPSSPGGGPSSDRGGGGQAPKKIEAYQCNLCPAVFGFKFNAKRHFQKLHPEDEYDGSKIANIKFKCYGCSWGFDTYGNLESHFAQVHQGQILNPEKVYLGDTQTTAATFQSVKRMKTPSKRKRPATSASNESISRPSSASSGGNLTPQLHQQPHTPHHQHHGHHGQPHQMPGRNEAGMPSHMMMGDNTSYHQGDLHCNSCDFTCDNPQSLVLHQQTHVQYNNDMQQQQPNQQPPQSQGFYQGPSNGMSQQQTPNNLNDPFLDFKVEEENLQYQQQHQMYQQPYQPQQHPPYPPPHPDQGYPNQNQDYQYGYNNQMAPQQYHQQYHHYPMHQQQQPPPAAPAEQASPHTPPQILSPPPGGQQQGSYQQAPTPPVQQQAPPAPQYQEVPPQPQSQQHFHQGQQSPYPHGGDNSNEAGPEALRNQHHSHQNNNGNHDHAPQYHGHHQQPQFHDLYPPSSSQNSPVPPGQQHHQGGGHHPQHEHPQQHVQQQHHISHGRHHQNGNNGGMAPHQGPPATGGVRHKRTNIGKMFPTHICFVCDSRLAKLDCIKMHFKNKHSETQLDLNKVMITRVCCYLCGVRKKEYAILVRHFQVEHKGHEIDPFRIGMDEPTPFNLSPEDEADLIKHPIPDPVRHEHFQNRIKKNNSTPAATSNTPTVVAASGGPPHTAPNYHQGFKDEPLNMDENTLDSIGDEYTSPMAGGNHYGQDPYNQGDESQDMMYQQQPKRKAPRRMNSAFKNNQCTSCSKAFSRVTTAKKHFLDQHPEEPFDRSKIKVTQLPCYLCDTMISDSRHALRHFETAHPGYEYDARQVKISGVELSNGGGDEDDLDESIEEPINNIPINTPQQTHVQPHHQTPPPSHPPNPTQPSMTVGHNPMTSPPVKINKTGFRCFLCNFWCSSIDEFQAHFSPDNKAHENVREVNIICPMCDKKCETTTEMFEHVTNQHFNKNNDMKQDVKEEIRHDETQPFMKNDDNNMNNSSSLSKSMMKIKKEDENENQAVNPDPPQPEVRDQDQTSGPPAAAPASANNNCVETC